jgi:hypothetical protein
MRQRSDSVGRRQQAAPTARMIPASLPVVPRPILSCSWHKRGAIAAGGPARSDAILQGTPIASPRACLPAITRAVHVVAVPAELGVAHGTYRSRRAVARRDRGHRRAPGGGAVARSPRAAPTMSPRPVSPSRTRSSTLRRSGETSGDCRSPARYRIVRLRGDSRRRAGWCPCQATPPPRACRCRERREGRERRAASCAAILAPRRMAISPGAPASSPAARPPTAASPPFC